MSSRVAAFAVVAAVASASLTSCTSAQDPVAWAGEVCTSWAPEVKKIERKPKVSMRSPESMQEALSGYMGKVIGALDGMIVGLREAGPPPVADGQKLAGQVRTGLGKARKAFLRVKSTIDSADLKNQRKFLAAVRQAGKLTRAVKKLDDPVKAFEDSRELSRAYRDAPSCQRLEKTFKRKKT